MAHRLHLRSPHRSASSTASLRYCAVCPELYAKPFGARQGIIYGWSDRSDCGRRRARPEHVTDGAIVPSQDGGVRGGPWRVGSRWTSTSTGRPHSAEASFQDGLWRAALLKPCRIAKLRCIAPYLSMANHTSSYFASSSRKRGHVRQRGGNSCVAEVAVDHAAAVVICCVAASISAGMSSAIGSVCM